MLHTNRWLSSSVICLGVVVLLQSCSHSGSRGPGSEVVPAPPLTPEEAALLQRAQDFDRFLKLDPESREAKALVERCNQNTEAEENPFCFGMLNAARLEEKARARRLKGAFHRKSVTRLRPKFRGKKILNWAQLQRSTLSSLIRAMESLSPSEMKLMKDQALAEKNCPNPVAVAVAATQEDLLPDEISLGEIAKLYEIGADCTHGNEGDKETLLTRSGLFYYAEKNYENASRLFVKSISSKNTFVGRPLYWLYRSQTELKNTAGANTSLEQLKTRYPFAFHTLMALTSSNRDPGEILSKESPNIPKRSERTPNLNPLIEEVELLWKFNLEASASKVLDWAVADAQGAEPEVMLYLAELKRDQGDYRSKISILTEVLYNHPDLISRETMELYFPKVYFPIFEKRASGLDPYLLLAVARRESAFNTRAVSSANARGLLQVLPATSRRFRAKANLFDPEHNVEAGARYLTQLLQKLDGNIHLALAAYNAGPNRVATWTQRYPLTEPILFMDLIPYRETREYVASVLRNYYWYRRIHRGEEKLNPQQLLQLALTQ